MLSKRSPEHERACTSVMPNIDTDVTITDIEQSTTTQYRIILLPVIGGNFEL
jgi:hypothetical protein